MRDLGLDLPLEDLGLVVTDQIQVCPGDSRFASISASTPRATSEIIGSPK